MSFSRAASAAKLIAVTTRETRGLGGVWDGLSESARAGFIRLWELEITECPRTAAEIIESSLASDAVLGPAWEALEERVRRVRRQTIGLIVKHASHPGPCRARIQCVRCGGFLTDWLEPVAETFWPGCADGGDLVPQGQYWLGIGIVPEQMMGHIFIHRGDRRGMADHADPIHGDGFPGGHPGGGPNQACVCGALVATEIQHSVHFEPAETVLCFAA